MRVREADRDEGRINLAGAQPPPKAYFKGEVLARGQFGLEPFAVAEVAEACAPFVAMCTRRTAVPFDSSLLWRQQIPQ